MASYRIISSDSHVFEPRDLWTTRIEPKYRGREPRVARVEDGSDWWFCEGRKINFMGPGAQVGVSLMTRISSRLCIRLKTYVLAATSPRSTLKIWMPMG